MGVVWKIFTLLYLFSSLSPSLWETVRYRLKYCLKGPLNPNQPTNKPIHHPEIQPSLSRAFDCRLGWLGGAKVLGKLPVPGRPTILITVGQGPTALAVGASWGCLDIFTLIYPFSSFSPSLWETARYRLKYCLKGPLNPKQPTIDCRVLNVSGNTCVETMYIFHLEMCPCKPRYHKVSADNALLPRAL